MGDIYNMNKTLVTETQSDSLVDNFATAAWYKNNN